MTATPFQAASLSQQAAYRRQLGMTLLEILLVVGLMVLIMSVGIGVFYDTGRAALADDAKLIRQLAKQAQVMAAQSGQIHRLQFSFEQNAYQIEVCQTGVPEMTEGDEQSAQLLKEAMEKLGRLPPEWQQPTDAYSAAARAAALAGLSTDALACRPADGEGLSKSSNVKGLRARLSVDRGVKLGTVYLASQREPIKEGLAGIRFYPIGGADKAIIEITLKEEPTQVFSVVIDGFSGSVNILDVAVARPDEVLFRDAEGKTVEPQ